MALAVEDLTPMVLVYDVPRSLAFYRDVLGFEIVVHSPPFEETKDNFGWALLRLGSAELMLNNMYEDNVRSKQPEPQRTHGHGDTTLYLACSNVDGAAASLRAKDVAVRGPINTYYGMRQVQLHDPDGYSVVLQWPVEAQT